MNHDAVKTDQAMEEEILSHETVADEMGQAADASMVVVEECQQ